MRNCNCVSRVVLIGAAALLCFARMGVAQTRTISATARVTNAQGVTASAPVNVTVTRFSTDAERQELMSTLERGDTAAVRSLLAKRAQIGSIRVGTVDTAIKYAYARTTSDGQLITAVTGSPIVVTGTQPPAGFDLGLVMIEVTGSKPGQGELVPATKVRMNKDGSIVTDGASANVVHLSDVVAK